LRESLGHAKKDYRNAAQGTCTMAITFTELNRTGEIVLGRYNDGETFLAYETRQPGKASGKVQIDRSPSLEKCAAVYWGAVAELVG
jgi:hypothetical protein